MKTYFVSYAVRMQDGKLSFGNCAIEGNRPIDCLEELKNAEQSILNDCLDNLRIPAESIKILNFRKFDEL